MTKLNKDIEARLTKFLNSFELPHGIELYENEFKNLKAFLSQEIEGAIKEVIGEDETSLDTMSNQKTYFRNQLKKEQRIKGGLE